MIDWYGHNFFAMRWSRQHARRCDWRHSFHFSIDVASNHYQKDPTSLYNMFRDYFHEETVRGEYVREYAQRQSDNRWMWIRPSSLWGHVCRLWRDTNCLLKSLRLSDLRHPAAAAAAAVILSHTRSSCLLRIDVTEIAFQPVADLGILLRRRDPQHFPQPSFDKRRMISQAQSTQHVWPQNSKIWSCFQTP